MLSSTLAKMDGRHYGDAIGSMLPLDKVELSVFFPKVVVVQDRRTLSVNHGKYFRILAADFNIQRADALDNSGLFHR